MAREGGAYLALGLGLLVANLKVLCALDGLQADGLAVGARQTQGDLLGSLRLLVEDGLRLTTKPSLLAVVPPLALRHKRGLAGLVLRNLEDLVVAALGRLAEGLGRLRGVHHCKVPARVGAETQASSGATGNERSATGVPRGQPADVGIIPNKRQFQLRQSPPGAAPLHPMTTTPHLLRPTLRCRRWSPEAPIGILRRLTSMGYVILPRAPSLALLRPSRPLRVPSGTSLRRKAGDHDCVPWCVHAFHERPCLLVHAAPESQTSSQRDNTRVRFRCGGDLPCSSGARVH